MFKIAMQEIGRELTHEEIKKIIDPITENIDWVEAISLANQHL